MTNKLIRTTIYKKFKKIHFVVINFLSHRKYITMASIASMSPFTMIDFCTQIYEKNTREVTTLHVKDQIVEKNNNFHIITAFLESSINSDKSGIVWLARKTGNINKIEIPINIARKYHILSPSKYVSKVFSRGKLKKV